MVIVTASDVDDDGTSKAGSAHQIWSPLSGRWCIDLLVCPTYPAQGPRSRNVNQNTFLMVQQGDTIWCKLFEVTMCKQLKGWGRILVWCGPCAKVAKLADGKSWNPALAKSRSRSINQTPAEVVYQLKLMFKMCPTTASWQQHDGWLMV